MPSGAPSYVFDSAPLGRVVSIQLGKMLQSSPSGEGDVEVPYLRAGLMGGAPELPTMWASPTELVRYRACRGDLLVAEGGDVGRAEFVPEMDEEVVLLQNSLHRVRGDAVSLRFLKYCLDSIVESGWLDVLCNRSTFGHLTGEKLSALQVPWPSAAHRQAIADFLDVETGRIDSLVQKRRRFLELLAERRSALLPTTLALRGHAFPDQVSAERSRWSLPVGWHVMHLSQTLDRLTNGYVGPTRDILEDRGVRYIQSLHIKGGQIDFNRRPFFVSEEWHRAHPRIQLREGDVLIVQTGDIGQVAVVSRDFGDASCHALQIARVNRRIITGEYLGEYLRSPFGYQSLLSRATGALHPHLEGGIRDVPVVVPPLDQQAEIVAEVRSARAESDRLEAKIRDQLALLQEHRQALITAAVTGQLDVTRAVA